MHIESGSPWIWIQVKPVSIRLLCTIRIRCGHTQTRSNPHPMCIRSVVSLDRPLNNNNLHTNMCTTLLHTLLYTHCKPATTPSSYPIICIITIIAWNPTNLRRAATMSCICFLFSHFLEAGNAGLSITFHLYCQNTSINLTLSCHTQNLSRQWHTDPCLSYTCSDFCAEKDETDFFIMHLCMW